MKADTFDHPRTRRTHPSFQYTDLTAIEEYLADMAFDGWRLVSIRNGFTFEECAPCKLRYSAEILPTASQMSNEITAESQAYIDLCAEAGWSFVANTADLYVFVTSDPDIPPDRQRQSGKDRRRQARGEKAAGAAVGAGNSQSVQYRSAMRERMSESPGVP